MSTPRLCSECGSALPESSRDGLCPRCLIGLALDAEQKTKVVSPPQNHISDLIGRVFGNYQLIEQIGQGGMGVVYKARQGNLNRMVALKLMLSGPQATAAEVERFLREATAAATLQHPNVVAIHEVGQHEGQHYFSMDYIEGQNLAQVIRRTPLAAERAARYVKTTAEAVQYAHQRGILHRDLKPANVLMDAHDQPRITDFGLAKQIEIDSELTLSGAVLGTPSYMPPEQAAGRRKEVSPASDVYSLGAILYDALTGRPPFQADTPVDTMRQVLDAEPAPPRILNPKVPRDLETICLKCLAKEPNRRFQTAQELADDLARFLKGEPIKARPIGRVARLWRWCRRNPGMAGLTATTTAFAVALGVSAVLFRAELINKNRNMAPLLATKMSNHLYQVSQPLLEVAQTDEFQTMVRAADTNRLFAYLERETSRLTANLGIRAEVENWVVMDLKGATLARVPLPDREPIMNRSSRDYFLGARRLTNAPQGTVHFSRLYKSKDDDKFKFGISAVVRENRSAEAKPIGIVTLMINTGSAEKNLGLNFPGQSIVLLAPPDPEDKDQGLRHADTNDYFVFFHPGLGNGGQVAGPVNVTRLLRRGWYRDPVVGGPVLTGVSVVSGTPYLLVIQSPDWVGLLSGVCLLLGAILSALFGLRWLVHWNKRKRETASSF